MNPWAATLTGLLLGLTSGSHCFWSCASVMGPYLVAVSPEASAARWSSVGATLRVVGWYNLGRLIAYLTVGALVALFARWELALPGWAQGVARLAAAAMLLVSLIRPSTSQRCWRHGERAAGALLLGVAQGISPCPPFIAAVGLGLQASGAVSALLLFVALFVGTSLYTLPLAFVEPIRRRRWLSWAMRAIGLLICAHLIAVGVTAITGGR